jgi:hypothetical protein
LSGHAHPEDGSVVGVENGLRVKLDHTGTISGRSVVPQYEASFEIRLPMPALHIKQCR